MYILLDCTMPPVVTGLLRQVYTSLMFIIPAGMVIFGTIDFLKAIMAKDDKANVNIFIKRLISAAAALLVFVLVKWVFGIIGNINGASEAFSCANEILNGKVQSSSSSNKKTTTKKTKTTTTKKTTTTTTSSSKNEDNQTTTTTTTKKKTTKKKTTTTSYYTTTTTTTYDPWYEETTTTTLNRDDDNCTIDFNYDSECSSKMCAHENSCSGYRSCLWVYCEEP